MRNSGRGMQGQVFSGEGCGRVQYRSRLTVVVAFGRLALPQHVPVEPATIVGAAAAALAVEAEGPEVEHGLCAKLHIGIGLRGVRADLGTIDLDQVDLHLGLPEGVEGRRKPEGAQVNGATGGVLDAAQS